MNNHVKTAVFEHNTHLYHLATRPFYTAIGQPDNRNRRERQPFTIKNKLMALDFVLAHRDKWFLATEQEKVEYFTRIVEVPLDRLPVKRYAAKASGPSTIRYFVEKFPIFVAPESGEVAFCFVDEGLTTASKFETYLNEYRSLLSAIPKFRSSLRLTPHHFDEPRAPSRGSPRVSVALEMDTASTLWLRACWSFFALRRRYESNALGELDRDRLIRLGRSATSFLVTAMSRSMDSGKPKAIPLCWLLFSQTKPIQRFLLPPFQPILWSTTMTFSARSQRSNCASRLPAIPDCGRTARWRSSFCPAFLIGCPKVLQLSSTIDRTKGQGGVGAWAGATPVLGGQPAQKPAPRLRRFGGRSRPRIQQFHPVILPGKDDDMKTYIPKQTKLTRDRVEVKLETGLAQKLERYCEYLESDRDYIISQALEIAFKKDRGFDEWLDASNGSHGVSKRA
ncbi:MAG: hypothetical protein IPJ98_17975 [Bryobacterales bacterium]|nr:hypothetical protein [Bryobacterales bacterium]